MSHQPSLSKCIKCLPEQEPLSPRTIIRNQQSKKKPILILTTTQNSDAESQEEPEQEEPDDFRMALEEVFPNDLTVGEKYIVINENMFVNENWIKLNKRIYRKQFLQHLKKNFPIPFLNAPKSYGSGDQYDQGFEFSNPLRFYIEIKDNL
jgi:hypothetical protein